MSDAEVNMARRELVLVKPPAPRVRRNQSDAEALLKLRGIVAMVQAGYMSPTEAWPFCVLEIGP